VKYRRFGKLDWKVSALGFGAMRLPIIGDDPAKIDEAQAIEMMRYAIDHGVNYVDTAYPYHHGNSEIVVGKTLEDGYRERVKLATKMPVWLVKSRQDMDRLLNEQLKRLQTDHVDFYLLHGLDKDRWSNLLDLKVFDWAEKAFADGRIKNLGFSFHDTYEVFKDIIDGYDNWTLCQIQYNYMDIENQAGTKGLRYAASKGLAVVIMEPIAGGMLAVNPPKEVQAIWDEVKTQRTPAEWALQWVWNQPEVSVVLSGMSTMQQVVENVESANRSGPDTLKERDLDLIAKVHEKYLECGFIGCTGCRYCMPCPNGVEIPEILKFLNEHSKMRGDRDAQEKVGIDYRQAIPKESGAKSCAKCGQCEELCPQHLPIQRLLEEATWTFERDR
jgi:predicted aldo/keto reductase-like oxidoreductase